MFLWLIAILFEFPCKYPNDESVYIFNVLLLMPFKLWVTIIYSHFCLCKPWLTDCSAFQSSANSESSNQSLCSAGSLSDKELEVSWKGRSGNKWFACIWMHIKQALFVADVRRQRREPLSRGAGREKETSMTAIVKVSQVFSSHWPEKDLI